MHLKTVGKPVALHLAVAIMLFGLVGSVWAEENAIRSFESYAMGGRVEAPRESAPEGRGPAPEILLHIGGRSFDPLQEAAPSNGGRSATQQTDSGGATGYYIVQFDGPIQPQWKAALAEAGVELFDYVPQFAFIARMAPARRETVQRLPHVRWVGAYQPAYRMSPSARSQIHLREGVDEKPEAPMTDLRVNLFPGVDPAVVAARIQAWGGEVRSHHASHDGTSLAVRLPADRVTDLAAVEGVKWIEALPQWELFNDVSADIMGVRPTWQRFGLYGEGQVVGVADSGLDMGSAAAGEIHEDFEDGLGNSRVVALIDRVPLEEGDAVGDNASDTDGHGTHVAGSVLGNGWWSGSDPATDHFPMRTNAGMAPKAGLVFQALNRNGTRGLEGIPADLGELFEEARLAGAHLHTNSWGSSQASAYTTFSRDVDAYMWHNPWFLILFSAGNDGVDLDRDGVIDGYSLGAPATAKNCLAVGATEGDRPRGAGYDFVWATGRWLDRYHADPIRDDHMSNNDRGLAAFSSRGPVLDGRYKPDIVAPGTNILSARTRAVAAEAGIGWGNYNDHYVWMGGTSMATPLAAGAAALMREYLMTEAGFDLPSAALIKAALLNSTEDISPGQYGAGDSQEIPYGPGPNNVTGWGRLNLGDGVFPEAPFNILFYDETTGLETGGRQDHTIKVTNSDAPLRVTLSWTDYPGLPSAHGALVNDLDLQLVAPSGAVHYPDSALQSTAVIAIAYDHDGHSGIHRAAKSYAVRFSPERSHAYLESVSFLYANGDADGNLSVASVDVVVYADLAGMPDPDRALLRRTLHFMPWGFHTIPLGVALGDGDFHIALERGADALLSMALEAGNPEGRTLSRDPETEDAAWVPSDDTALIRANVRYTPDWSTDCDRVNNNESITLQRPEVGRYTLRVTGYNTPYGPQPYALVASGYIVRSPGGSGSHGGGCFVQSMVPEWIRKP
ncbi:MAG: S8 family serine peptidase [Desulfatitalea sp.]|nr:S8 family serine peptidase [Desulfatitalea sp.]